ncbi:hypothetical protein SORBI_3001G424132 [Sorghum bicolor]|nr:hypothetical protein SORBI_3001G424132 [Sorghum bicolor]
MLMLHRVSCHVPAVAVVFCLLQRRCQERAVELAPAISPPAPAAAAEASRSPTTLAHIVFVIGASKTTWAKRGVYTGLWWRPGATRGHVWLDGEPSGPWHPSWPPYRVLRPNAARFGREHAAAARMAQAVAEAYYYETAAAAAGPEEGAGAGTGSGEARWLVMGDDDTVFFPENLAAVLDRYDHREMYYVGSSSESVGQNVAHSYAMAFGGGGYAVSFPAAAALAGIMDGCLDRYNELYGSDHRVQACLAELGVPLTREPGFHQVNTPFTLLAIQQHNSLLTPTVKGNVCHDSSSETRRRKPLDKHQNLCGCDVNVSFVGKRVSVACASMEFWIKLRVLTAEVVEKQKSYRGYNTCSFTNGLSGWYKQDAQLNVADLDEPKEDPSKQIVAEQAPSIRSLSLTFFAGWRCFRTTFAAGPERTRVRPARGAPGGAAGVAAPPRPAQPDLAQLAQAPARGPVPGRRVPPRPGAHAAAVHLLLPPAVAGQWRCHRHPVRVRLLGLHGPPLPVRRPAARAADAAPYVPRVVRVAGGAVHGEHAPGGGAERYRTAMPPPARHVLPGPRHYGGVARGGWAEAEAEPDADGVRAGAGEQRRVQRHRLRRGRQGADDPSARTQDGSCRLEAGSTEAMLQSGELEGR